MRGSRTVHGRGAMRVGILLVILIGMGSVTGCFASGPRDIGIGNAPTADSSGWAMVKPYIPVTTHLVIPSNRVRGTDIASFALHYVGYPYTLTGNSPQLGFSCIGFVSYVYRSLGIPLPDDLDNARAFAPAVSWGSLRRGDILWFGNTVWPGLSHTAIYLGGGRFVHAAWFNRGVIVSSLHHDPVDGEYWAEHYLGASRPWGGWKPPITLASVERIPDEPVLLVMSHTVKMRRWWAAGAPVREALPQATPLTVLAAHGRWYQVVAPDGTTGWIAAVTHVESAPEPEQAQSMLRSSARQWRKSQVRTARRHKRHTLPARRARRVTRRAHSLPRAAVRHPHPGRHQVTATIRVRAKPSLHGHVIGLVAAGMTVHVTGTRGAWSRIALKSGSVGYVYSSYVR